MRDRKGDWRDVLASHSLAVDTKKLWLGFVATLATIAVFTIVAAAYGALTGGGAIGQGGLVADGLVSHIMTGQGMSYFGRLLSLLNPLAGGIAHFVLSIFLYMLVLAVWSYCGGGITRLAALQYARDDIPTLSDALDMVRDKRNAYYFAPITPLFGVIIFAVCNMVIGLIACIPYIGPWITAVCLPFVSLPASLIATFIIVLGVATFGLMFPAVSIGGKDAFEGWSSAYSYLLWGFNRFVGYTVLAAVVGALTTLIAWGLAELFIWVMVNTLSLGVIGGGIVASGGFCKTLLPLSTSGVGMSVASWIVVLIGLIARALVVAYAFSYFFTANTVICFLLRKHVDRIEVDEVYEETPEEEELAGEDFEAPEPQESPAQEAAAPVAEEPEVEEEPSEAEEEPEAEAEEAEVEEEEAEEGESEEEEEAEAEESSEEAEEETPESEEASEEEKEEQ